MLRRRLVSTIGALVAALLSGCSVAPPTTLPLQPVAEQQVPSIALPAFARTLQSVQPVASGANALPSRRFIYTAQLYGDDAKVYQRQELGLTYFETLTLGLSKPQGTVATPDGRWYVANAGHQNVLVFRSTNHGPQGPIASLDDFGEFPGNVGVTPDRRLVAVSNIATTNHGSGSVSVYLNREAEPSRYLTFGVDRLQGAGVAIDHQRNCYWSFNNPNKNNGSIVAFAGCAGSGNIVVQHIGYAGGLAFDQSGDLFYVDQTTGIFKCVRTSQCKLFATGFGVPLNINFDRRSKHLWVSDLTGYIDAVDPTTGKIESRTPAQDGSADPPFGIAPEPGA